MKQFDLQEYLKNPDKKIITRDGRSVRIICTDREDDLEDEGPIVALVYDGTKGQELSCFYYPDGRYYKEETYYLDLFFAPEPKTKKVGWMNVCKYGDNQHFSLVGGVIHPTREQALTERQDYVVDTIQIGWEE